MLSRSDASGVGGPVTAQARAPWLKIRGLTKQFMGELAVDRVDLDIEAGQVHGLVGANGAGKSTLIRCLAGVTTPDEGEILIDGRPLTQGSTSSSERAGLGFVHQELNLIPHFTALQNMLLGMPKQTRFGLIDWKRSRVPAEEAARRVGIGFSLDTKVSDLNVAQRWLVMIAKALVRKANLIAMDEPTASLSPAESEQLFRIVRELAAQGVAILYVSHRLEEVLDLCDRITVMRDGRIVSAASRGELDKKGLVRAIIGRDAVVAPRAAREATVRNSQPVFSARNISWRSAVTDVSFDVHPGEVFALAGLVGAGRTELAQLIYGVHHPHAGRFEFHGKPYLAASPADAVKMGVALVPEERRSQALMLQKSVADNINVAALRRLRSIDLLPFVSNRKANTRAKSLIGELQIKTAGPDQRIGGLSGGNQQKAVIGRWLGEDTRLLILDEPSRGVDIGAREEIHAAIRRLARQGIGIIVISSDVEELTVLADRVVVLHEGRVTGELEGAAITESNIIALSYAEHPASGDSET
ncbi:sugar ABC transporter ATP-binding protein [Ensifer soli]|uniref:sugar ABC transporter ATP-binding protein n=1 Tax=Ciceribacter sp. sgz301302 TaxID=3342379 RepID=UPI0035B6ED77